MTNAEFAAGEEHDGAGHILRLAEPAHRNGSGECGFAIAAGRNDLVEHVRALNGTGRHHVDGDAEGRELQRPGAAHADEARLGRRIGGAAGGTEGGTRGDQHDAAEAALFHLRQRCVEQDQRRPEMELRQGRDVRGLRGLDGIGSDDAGVMDDVRDVVVARDLGRQRLGGLGVEQIDRVGLETRMRPVGLVEGQRNHAMAALEQRPGDGRTDAATRAGDDRGMVVVHARRSADGNAPRGTRASTRSGLPDPRRIFSGAARITDPVGGSRSRLARHCRP